MQLEVKADRLAECTRIGRELAEVERRRNDLIDRIHRLEANAADLRSRLADIESRIASIQFAEDTARSARSGGAGGAVAGEITAQAIRLATQKDQLEREKYRIWARLSTVEHDLSNSRRQFDQATYIFTRLNSVFADLDCPLGLRDFG